jgi:hypothetical protein
MIGCTPGLFFDIKNCTGEIIEIDYDICDDLLINLDYSVRKKHVQVRLENEETFEIVFSKSDLFNRGVTREDYFKTETFLSFFENITIKFPNSDSLLDKNDLNQCKIECEKKLSAYIFTLRITSRRSRTT